MRGRGTKGELAGKFCWIRVWPAQGWTILFPAWEPNDFRDSYVRALRDFSDQVRRTAP